MLAESLSTLFSRDLAKVKSEIEAYSSEEAIWKIADGITNSSGNLALHIAGNLQHFFGAVLGGTDYKRDREFEFAGKVDRETLLSEIDAAEKSIAETLKGMPDFEFKNTYPLQPFGHEMTTEWFFLHLYSHMLYHLGQINYLRRMTES